MLHGSLLPSRPRVTGEIVRGSNAAIQPHWGPHMSEVIHLLFLASDFGLFLSDDDPKKGIWLEAGKALDYYMLRNGVSVTSSRTTNIFFHQLPHSTSLFSAPPSMLSVY